MVDSPYKNTRSEKIKSLKFDRIETDIDMNGNIKDLIDYDIKDSKKTPDIVNLLSTLINKSLNENIEEYDDEEELYTEEEELYLENLNKKEKKEILKQEELLKKYKDNEIPLRFKILNSSLDLPTKHLIIQRLEQFYLMDSTDNEYHKYNKWLEGVDKIPFNKYSSINKDLNTEEKISNYLLNSKKILNDSVYGHMETKNSILQFIATMITNKNSKGSVLALQGPPGNGKTSLVKNGLSKAIDRPFSFTALGGATDSSFLDGFEFTYEGSKWGRIIDILHGTQRMDTIFYFDELDKVSDTPKGEEIMNILCHITDPSQNEEFMDKYYSGIKIDISKATFIFSFNDPSKISPILLDRLNVIKTDEFDVKDKIKIAEDYLIKEICDNIGFKQTDIILSNEILRHIITTHTNEKGVRNFKRCLETIISKINVLKITNNNSEILSYNIKNLTFPFELTNKHIESFLKKKEVNASYKLMYT